MNAADKKVRELSQRVNCGYLILSRQISSFTGRVNRNEILVECHNLKCGPQHGCDLLDKGKCKYRSKDIKTENLYNPQGLSS